MVEMNEELIKVCPECNRPVYFKSINQSSKNYNSYKCYNCNKWIEKPIERIRNQKYWHDIKRKKTHIENADLIRKEQLIEQLKNLKETGVKLRNQALISMLYLTASRVEEIVGFVNQITRETIMPPLKVGQVRWDNFDGEEFMIIDNVPTLKRKLKGKDAYGKEIKRIPTRTIGVLVRDEKVMVDYIKAHWKIVSATESILPDITRPMFKMSYQNAWRISSSIELPNRKAFNHYWRHLRLSHLASDYGFTDMQLQQYVNWANTNMATKYVHLDWRSLGKLMIYSSRQKDIGGNEAK